MLSRLRQEAVGWDDPLPVVGKRPRGRPRKQGRAWKLAHRLPMEPVTPFTVVLYRKAACRQVVWRDVGLRDGTDNVRVGAMATQPAPIVLARTAVHLPPTVMIQLEAARLPMARARRDLTPSWGGGDYQGQTWWAMHRCGHLALTACCRWRLTLLQEQQAPWLSVERTSSAGELPPPSVSSGFTGRGDGW